MGCGESKENSTGGGQQTAAIGRKPKPKPSDDIYQQQNGAQADEVPTAPAQQPQGGGNVGLMRVAAAPGQPQGGGRVMHISSAGQPQGGGNVRVMRVSAASGQPQGGGGGGRVMQISSASGQPQGGGQRMMFVAQPAHQDFTTTTASNNQDIYAAPS